jgi:MYXO-CTERM domain-containing protein
MLQRSKQLFTIFAPALVCLLPARADAVTVLLSQHNQSKVHTWDSANPGAAALLHSVQCNDADINLPEGSPHGWIAEHFTDHFGRFVIGSGMGLDAQYNVPYAYPKHITVYNGDVVVMSRNDGTLFRYSPAGAAIGSVKTAQNTGQGMATDGDSLFVSLWTGSASTFVRYDAAFTVQQMFGNPTGMGAFNNIVDFVHDKASGHFFGLATTGEGGTGTESTTVLEFEMGGAVVKSYALPFACDGIGSYLKEFCGDGKVGVGEACDDGNKVDTDACTSACKLAACGDGLVQAGVEACDDGNKVDEDACTNACKAAACGDGIVQAGVEVCDDGNQVAEDACTNACEAAVCGDGVVQDGVEGCDDGNMVDEDACTSACVLASCGDGIVQDGVEGCDDGNMVDDDACTNACVMASCGDGVVQAGEVCDDPNDPSCVDCMIVAGSTGTSGEATTGSGTTGEATTGAGTTDDSTTTSGGTGGDSASGGATEAPTTGGTGSGETTGTAASTGTGGDTGTDTGGAADDGCGCSSGPGDRGGLALGLIVLGLLRPRRRR